MALDHPWKDTALEIYVSNFRGPDEYSLPSHKLSAGLVSEVSELNSDIKEADLRCIVHALHAVKQECNQLVIFSSDTDVLNLFLYYWNELHYQGCSNLWIKTGSGGFNQVYSHSYFHCSARAGTMPGVKNIRT